MDVICLEDKAFQKLVELLIEKIKEVNTNTEERWVPKEEAMHILGIKSKSTLKKYRDSGYIKFSQPHKKIILYNLSSINNFLEKHSKQSFT